jgi:hypothetical protein
MRKYMPKHISEPSTIKAILNGFSEAQENYANWSGGRWLWQAPEYFISSTIAKKIAEVEAEKYITLEHGATLTLEEAGAKGRGRLPRHIRAKGKVDILLWWGGEEPAPRAVIEIKNQISSKEQYEKDIKRLVGFLERKTSESSLDFGVFAFYDSAFNGDRKMAKDKIKDKIEKIYENSSIIAGNGFSITKKTTKINLVEDSAWAATCFLIKRI